MKKITLIVICLFTCNFIYAQTFAGGGDQTIITCNNGVAYSWGYNWAGQLGDGTTQLRSSPVQVSTISGIISVAGGFSHSLALKNDGTVWDWGYNAYGQLGDGTTTNRTTPIQVNTVTGIILVAGGANHSLALKNDGTVWAWGRNNYGQLGDSTTVNRLTPIQVIGLTGIIAIAGGWESSYALKNDGTVWSWGRNYYGQLGDSTVTQAHIPIHVATLSGITAISAGDYHCLALKNDGTVWSWGKNDNGQLGIGSTGLGSSIPLQINSLAGMIGISADGWHSLALKSDGTVWAWGWNYQGQLGNGTANTTGCSCIASPTQSSISGIIAVSGGYQHCLALKNDGTLWAWGSNEHGQIGDNGALTMRTTPVQVTNLCSIPTSIQMDNSQQSLNLFPNPATSEIIVESGKFNVERIEMYSVVGERVLTHPQPPLSNAMANAQRGLRIDVSALRAGIYFVAVTDEAGNRVVRKVVKM